MKGYKRWIAALLAVLLTALTLTACDPPDVTLTEEQLTRLNQKFDGYVSKQNLSAAVYVVHHGEVIYDTCTGYATDDRHNSPDVVYGVASLTKQFTAASIMQLYDAEKLDINDKLSKYFPDYAYGDKITLSQLMSMRSGIPDYSVESAGEAARVTCSGDSSKGVTIYSDYSAKLNREIIRDYFLSQDLRFEPGTKYNYSDSNFALLAEIVAMDSGESYHDYVREHIFEPLGMDKSAFIDDYDDAYYVEKGITVAETDRKEFNRNYYDFKGAEYGCGDLLTSPTDMYKWYRGFTGGEVVSEDSYRRMTENRSKSNEVGYGYGLMLSGSGAGKVVYHYGYIPSYYSSVLFIPEYDFFVAVFANHAGGKPQTTAADMATFFGDLIGFEVGYVY